MSVVKIEKVVGKPIRATLGSSKWHKRIWLVVVIAFLLRLLVIIGAHQYRVRTTDANFGFGWEMGRIAYAIATGQGFSDPFTLSHTGPTAWEPPVYPYIIAGVFKISGIYTTLSAFLLLALNSLFSALTCIPVFYIARRIFGLKIARWSAWTWALFPYAMYWAVKWIWETSITQFLLATLLLITLQLEERPSGYFRWILWGFLWGLAALTNPAVLSLLPFFGIWVAYRRGHRKLNWLIPSTLAALVFAATVSPWLVRNYKTFGQFVFIRSNFGAELRMGNGPNANGLWMSWLHPAHNQIELQKYQRMGELAYVIERKHEALDWIRSHPIEFVKISGLRFMYFWAYLPSGGSILALKNCLYLFLSVFGWWGLALTLKHRKHAAWLLASLLLVYPAVYYFVFPHPRYAAPIHPIFFILVVYFLSQIRKRSQIANQTYEMPGTGTKIYEADKEAG